MERPAEDSGRDGLTDMETNEQTGLGSQQRQRHSCHCGQGVRGQVVLRSALEALGVSFPAPQSETSKGSFQGHNSPSP